MMEWGEGGVIKAVAATKFIVALVFIRASARNLFAALAVQAGQWII